MDTLIDKCIILICCSIFLMDGSRSVLPVFVFVTAFGISCLNTYFDQSKVTVLTGCLYLLLSFLVPPFCLLLPLIFYDFFARKFWYLSVIGVAACLRYLTIDFQPMHLSILVYFLLSFLLCYRTETFQKLSHQLKISRDNSRELNLLLENKNKDLLEKQDYEIHLATLKERNRIAREIHDNVGHMLSRSILQTGALLAVNKDNNLKAPLLSVKDTLSSAMDSIRESVHDLHDDSIDLYDTIRTILKDYKTYETTLEYDMSDNLPRNVKYCFIMLIKEGLSNIVKHSDASHIVILVREHPSFYQIQISDNGNPLCKASASHGIGLENMQERVQALHGTFRTSIDNGFKIFASVPKNT